MYPPLSKTTIGIMGSGSDEHPDLAEPLGRLLARLKVNLLTGAGRGVMTSVSRAFTCEPREVGVCIGIVPCSGIDHRETPRDGYPNPFVELPIHTHLPDSGEKGTGDLSRNHINILTSAAIVALPGGTGTASEVELAVRYGKPVVAFSSEPSAVAGFPQNVRRVSDLAELEAFLRPHLSNDT